MLEAIPHLSAMPLDLRAKAVEVQRGEMTDEAFLGWIHEAIGHEGPSEYQDLVGDGLRAGPEGRGRGSVVCRV